MNRRHTLATAACLAVALSGCSREQERRVQYLERDNQRLSTELSAAQTEQRALERERAWLLRQEQTSAPAPVTTSAETVVLADDDLSLPSINSIDHDVDLATTQPAAGAYVLVLASVGASFAESEHDQYSKVAAELNKSRPGGLSALFGLRTPRKGGLQLVYGASSELGLGIDRQRCQQALGVLDGRYRDAYILDTR